MEEVWKELFLKPVHDAFRDLVSPEMLRRLVDARLMGPGSEVDGTVLGEVETKALRLLGELKRYSGGSGEEAAIARAVRTKVEVILHLPALENRHPGRAPNYRAAVSYLKKGLGEDRSVWCTLLAWAFVSALGEVSGRAGSAEQSRRWIDELMLGRALADALVGFGLDQAAAWRVVGDVQILTQHQPLFQEPAPKKALAGEIMRALVADDEVRRYLRVNTHNGTVWFYKEAFAQLAWWVMAAATISVCCSESRPVAILAVAGTSAPKTGAVVPKSVVAWHAVVEELLKAEMASGYQLEKLLEALIPGAKTGRGSAVKSPASKEPRPRKLRARKPQLV